MIEIKNLHKNFDNLEVLKGVSLNIKKGEIVSIIGSSGSGKSTLLRCINLLENPTHGEIFYKGENILDYNEKQWQEYRGKHCSIVFQDALTALNPTMNVGNQIVEKILLHKKVSSNSYEIRFTHVGKCRNSFFSMYRT